MVPTGNDLRLTGPAVSSRPDLPGSRWDARVVLRAVSPERGLFRRQRDAEHLVYHSPKPRRDGPSELVLTPLELIDKIATLVAPSRTHRHRYYDVLALNPPLRATVTALAPAVVIDPSLPDEPRRTTRCEPSRNGLSCDWPHRQSRVFGHAVGGRHVEHAIAPASDSNGRVAAPPPAATKTRHQHGRYRKRACSAIGPQQHKVARRPASVPAIRSSALKARGSFSLISDKK